MRYSILCVVLLFSSGFALAQQNFLGLNVKGYDPLAGLNENIDAVPIGMSIDYRRLFRQSRFSVGGEFGIAMYTSNDYTLSYQGTDIKVNEEDCFWTVHAIGRYDIVRTAGFIAYLDARLGMTTFFSSIVAYEENSPYPGEFNFHGTAFNSGLGAGLMFRPRALFEEASSERSIWITLGANYNTGSYTNYRYMPEGGTAISLDEGSYASLTNYMGYQLGVQFKF